MRGVEDQIAAFLGAANDRPGGAPTRSYLLCSSPRTGSNMLARALSATSSADGPGHAEAARRVASRYDAAAIARSLAAVVADDEGWIAMLAAADRPALVLHYEDMAVDFPAALRAVSDHLGLGLTVPDGLAPPTVRLGDATNAAWEERFRRDVLGA